MLYEYFDSILLITWKPGHFSARPLGNTSNILKLATNDAQTEFEHEINGAKRSIGRKIEGLKESADSELIVFNRWGSEVYRKANYDNSWNGSNQNGEMLIEDTYFYILRLGNKSFEGFVIIKRNWEK